MTSLGPTVLITGHKHSARTVCINDRGGAFMVILNYTLRLN